MMIPYTEISNTDLVELRDLRSFVTVVRLGSFTAAADALGYTQSAVSQHVAALEAELGHALLHRRPVRPTPTGERLAEHAARILLRVDVARSELARLDRSPPMLVVAVCPLASPWLLAAALRELRSTSPSLQVTVRSVDPDSAVAQVASGAVDLALVDGITGPSEALSVADAGLLSSAALSETPLVVALSHDHPLGNRESIDLDVLADAPWIVAPGLTATGGAHPLSRAVPLQPRSLVYEGSDLPTLLALVAAGHGAVLLPAPSCTGAAGIATIPLRWPRLVHRTELLTLRGGSAHHRRLVDALRTRAPLALT
jgi:DNA-binding transcriptional LysR family regulator